MARPRFNRKHPSGLISLKFAYHRAAPLPFTWSTRQHCALADWDATAGRAKVSDPMRQPHLVDLNSLLNRIADEVMAFHRRSVGKVELTRELYKAHMDATFYPEPQTVEKPLTLDRHIFDMIADRSKNPERKVENTLDSMGDIARMLQRFAKETRNTLEINLMDRAWMDSFVKWAYANGYAKSSVRLYLSRIRATVKDANTAHLATADLDQISTVKVSVKKGELNKLYLEPEELDAIAAIDWRAVPELTPDPYSNYKIKKWRLQRMADVLLANCDTGTRHSDLSKLRKENLKTINRKQYIEVVTQKTKSRVLIPIFGQLADILERYGYDLPTVTKSEMILCGRIVLELAGCERQVAYRSTKGGKLSTEYVPVYRYFSPHVCRRTFARTAYIHDPSLLPHIQAILGHATPEQTLDYMDLTDAYSADAFVRKMERQEPNRLRAVK